MQNGKFGQNGLQKYEQPTKDFCLIENREEYFSEIKSSSNLKKNFNFELKRIISIFLTTSTIFLPFCRFVTDVYTDFQQEVSVLSVYNET